MLLGMPVNELESIFGVIGLGRRKRRTKKNHATCLHGLKDSKYQSAIANVTINNDDQ
jgi:hypothetical protein